jgi:glycerophosphoryl diester phosphodiesterase
LRLLYDIRVHPAVAANRPLIFAHRGGAGLAPENTLPAFDRGLSLGADGLELDVHLSRDGVPVVHHDALLDRTTDARGPIGERTVSELARVNACVGFTRTVGSWDGDPAGVPTLREVLRRYAETRLIIEIKGSSTVLARAVVQEVREAGALERTCIGGFSWRALREVRRCEPRLATSASKPEVRVALYASWTGLIVRPGRYDTFQVPECAGVTRVVSRRFVRLAHEADLAVQVWTVDEPAHMRRLLDWGADAIITDRPDLAIPTLREWMEVRGVD